MTLTVTVREKRQQGRIVVFDREFNKENETIVTGSASVAAPAERISHSKVATPYRLLRRNDIYAEIQRQCGNLLPTACAVVHPCDHDSLLDPIVMLAAHARRVS